MYEVELKVELSFSEKESLIQEFKKRDFKFKDITPQNDYYIEAQKSPHGGYNLKRYRNETGKYIYTEKIWEIVNNQRARKENEHEVSKEEFESAVIA